MDHAARGAAALSGGDPVTAVTAYTQALIEHPSSPDYFIQRSTAFTRLKPPYEPQHQLSLKDAEYAVLLGQKRARREKIQAAQQRRVIALFGLQQYENAAFVLSTMERWRTTEKKDKMEGDMWKAKINQRLKALPEGDPAKQVTVNEYPGLELPSDSAMKKLLQAQLKADGTFRFPGDNEGQPAGSTKTDIIGGEAAKSPGEVPKDGIKMDQQTTVSTAPVISTSKANTKPPQQLSKIRHEWFQNAQNVTVTIYAKGVPKDKAEIEINDDSISVSFPHPADPASTFSFTLDPLFALIDPTGSKSSIMSTKVELTLRKKFPSQKWSSLEGQAPLKATNNDDVPDSAAKAAVPSTVTDPALEKAKETAPSYPTSSKSGPKDWDKLASDLTAKKKSSYKHKDKADNEKAEGAESGHEHENEDDDSDYGGDPVDKFFKKLYAGADDDTRRAMMKSYQESGGTALSTDWKDVGKRRVEPVESKND